MRLEKVDDINVIVGENKLEHEVLSKLGFYAYHDLNVKEKFGIELKNAQMVFLYDNGDIGVKFRDVSKSKYEIN